MRRLEMEPTPLLLGFVLAPLMEERLRQSLQLAHGDWRVFVMQPLAASLLLAALCAPVLLLPALKLRMAQEPPTP